MRQEVLIEMIDMIESETRPISGISTATTGMKRNTHAGATGAEGDHPVVNRHLEEARIIIGTTIMVTQTLPTEAGVEAEEMATEGEGDHYVERARAAQNHGLPADPRMGIRVK